MIYWQQTMKMITVTAKESYMGEDGWLMSITRKREKIIQLRKKIKPQRMDNQR